MRAPIRQDAESGGFSDVRRVPNRRRARMEARDALDDDDDDDTADFAAVDIAFAAAVAAAAAVGPVERRLMRCWENTKVGRC